MSLTSLITKNRNAARLFSLLPDFTSVTKTYQPIGIKESQAYIKRHEKSNSALVGRAFDCWCRAFIQKENQMEKERDISPVVLAGLEKAFNLGYLTDEGVDILLENIEIIWKMRRDYINGLPVSENDLLKGYLILAYLEDTYYNNIKPLRGYLDIRIPDFVDLKNLTEASKANPRIFRTEKDIFLNPTFGNYSEKVGGVNADYIIGNMLVDIKTTKEDRFAKEHLHQLVGYYLLAKYDESFPCDIKQIGIFFPRFQKLAYVEIQDIEKTLKLEVFAKWFQEIVEGEEETFDSMDYQTMKRKLYK